LAVLVVAAAAPGECQDEPTTTAPWAVVLGIAQDGGYPQAGTKQHAAWEDSSLSRRVTCIAIVDPASGERWMLDVTPDFKAQLRHLDELAPHPDTPGLAGLFPTHAHTGHYTGLLHLGHEMMGADGAPVFALPRMRAFLESNLPWRDLVERRNISLRPLSAGVELQLNDRLRLVPLLVPHRDEYSETAAFRIEGPGRSLLYLPDIDKWERWDEQAGAGEIERQIAAVDVAYIDGTFYGDGEIPDRSMADIPHPFIAESLERFASLPATERRKIRFIHLNRSNPALEPSSEIRTLIVAAGFGLAEEGERQPL
jgi:pyrroloquinoline quinone biosynthesis protein B